MMRITYVLPEPVLGGGNKVTFQHAELLRRRGHDIAVVAEGERPGWASFKGRFVDSRGQPVRLPSQDLVVGTYWTTLRAVRSLELGPMAHFCQGYEGGLSYLAVHEREIERVYAWKLPTIAVTPAVSELLKSRFGTDARVVPPSLDPLFRTAFRRRPRRRPWIAVPGVFEAEVKGVEVALRAIARLRAAGLRCRVLRFSTLALSPAEMQMLPPDRYLCLSPPSCIARELRGCDLLLLPTRPAEGFGLPLLEAMVSGVPAVASRTGATEFMTAEAMPLVPVDDDEALASCAQRLLTHPPSWRRVRRRGLRAASRFSPQRIGPELEAAISWAAQLALATSPS